MPFAWIARYDWAVTVKREKAGPAFLNAGRATVHKPRDGGLLSVNRYLNVNFNPSVVLHPRTKIKTATKIP